MGIGEVRGGEWRYLMFFPYCCQLSLLYPVIGPHTESNCITTIIIILAAIIIIIIMMNKKSAVEEKKNGDEYESIFIM